ncbi:KAP family P-loop NTPase fold protein [Lutibacter citreus]|uniref:KAP family P-loop NTPase fold protein n=1 Tax=Lutibacter citreus TaxID=2138210 RepID=UPI000DBE9881|nr:P-loop NTPase fold protein [Lutibacter citreus]
MNFLKDNLKVFIVFIISVSLSLIFIAPLSNLLLLLGRVLDYDSTSFKLGGYSIFIILILAYLYLIDKAFIHNKRLSFLIFYSVTTYFFIRLVFTNHTGVLLQKRSFIFLDLIFLLAAAHLINLIRGWTKEIEREENYKKQRLNFELTGVDPNFFIEDKVFKNEEIDNEAILQKLIKVVTGFKPEIAFSIGINAVWGYGKSSFLERFEKIYKKNNKKSIVFWYHIWKNKGSTAIIENFFDELKQSLKPYSAEISEDINNYVKSILSLSNSDLNKVISVGMDVLSENQTLEKYHKSINDSIKKIDKQIVILLDDLDRLEKDEILNSLKLIRTLSDFNNVVFIAGYDREYVVKTIEKSKDNYLDKIFNVEINLLPFDYQLIQDELLRQIDIAFSINKNEEALVGFNSGFRELFTKKQLNIDDINIDVALGSNKFNCSNYELSYKDFFKTYRDVKRFVNEFKFNATLTKIEKNVIAEEYILLKLLTFKYRELPNLVFDRINEILKSGQLDVENNKIQVFGGSISNDIYFYDNESKNNLINLLDGIYSTENIEIINAVICKLFSEKPKEYYQLNQNSISKIYYTNIYLRNNILGAAITITELQKAFEENDVFSFSKKFVSSKSQSKPQLLNEIKQFIYNNKTTSKEQFIDSLKSLNIISFNQGFSDNQKVVEIISQGYLDFYSEDKNELVKDIIKLILNPDINYLEQLLSELNINAERKKSKQNYGAGIVTYKNNPYSSVQLKEILLSKLQYTIEQKSDPIVVFKAYHLHTEKIVSDKTIIQSKEANKLLRLDIEQRFRTYLSSDYFDFMSTIPMVETDFEFDGWQPNYFFAQVFSKERTYDELMANPDNKELYKLFIAEGWDNFRNFIESINVLELDLNEKRQMSMNIGKKLVQAFIKNNYTQLNWSQYSSIWNKE